MPLPVTVASFRARFPSFRDAEDVLLQEHIDAAARLYTAPVLGATLAEEVILYRAADTVACSPWGRYAALSTDDRQTVFGLKLTELLKSAPVTGMWTAGDTAAAECM